MDRSSDSLRPYVPRDPYEHREYYSIISITLGELVDSGWIDWTHDEWHWHFYSPEQKTRLEEEIEGRFWLREISITPPEAWRRAFIRTLNEAMRKAAPMYEVLEKSRGVLDDGGEWHKRRTVSSDFPATLLNGSSQDYASSGLDLEYETSHDAGTLAALERLRDYEDPDIYILDRLETCFSSLVSVNLNGF